MSIEGQLTKSYQESKAEKIKSGAEQVKSEAKKSSEEIDMERFERMMAEADSREEDLKKIEAIEKSLSLTLDETKKEMNENISDLRKARIASVEAADGYREISGEEMEQKEKEIRAEGLRGQPVAEIQPEAIDDATKNQDVEGVTLAEKNDAETVKYFSKAETRGAKTYDRDGNEIVSEYKKPESAKKTSTERSGEEEIVAEKKPTAEERARIQMEALSDFRRDLKKSAEAKKIDELMSKAWELRAKEQPVRDKVVGENKMEGASNVVDINSAKREKPSVNRDIKNEKPALPEEKEKVLMEAIVDFRKELQSDNRLLKMFNRIVDLLGVGKAKVPEAARIDRIISGDRRSDEAVKIDNAAEKAFEIGKKEKEKPLKIKLAEAQSIEDLLDAISDKETITNKEGKKYTGSVQKNHIRNYFETGNPEYLMAVTRSEDLRKHVKRVYDLARNKESLEQKKAA